jgi:hypothetical protein
MCVCVAPCNSAHIRAGISFTQVLDILTEMERRRLSPDRDTYDQLIRLAPSITRATNTTRTVLNVCICACFIILLPSRVRRSIHPLRSACAVVYVMSYIDA